MQVMTRALEPIEQEDLLRQFEEDISPRGRLDKERLEMWARNAVYQDGNINSLFLAYMHGYVYGRRVKS